MRAKDLLKLLEVRHSRDVVVPECNTNGGILDAWVMVRYGSFTVHGYEIKVSRSDFVRDEKWRGYLPYCHRFSFVCPWGMIQLEELPDEVGLLWAARPGTRLYIRRKAVHRNVVIPISLWQSLLSNRFRVGRPFAEENSQEYWREWLAGKEQSKSLGRRVSITMKHRYRREVEEVRQRIRHLESRLRDYEEMAAVLTEAGLMDSYRPADALKQRLAYSMGPDLTRVLNELHELWTSRSTKS